MIEGGGALSAPTEPPATDPPRGRSDAPGFRADIQGLRTLAVVMVVVFHSGVGLSGGFLGVDVFFVISGFVIARMLLFEQTSTGRIAIGRFYARRVRRLLPALALVLVVVAAVSTFALSPLGTLRTTVAQIGAGAALYVANFALLHYQKVGYFELGATSNPLLHTWTLAVEEQFYLFFPLLLVLIARIRRPRRWGRTGLVAGIVAALAVLSFLLGAALSGAFGTRFLGISPHERFAFFSPLTRAWEFLAGVLVACAEPVARRLGPRLAPPVGLAGIVAIGCSTFLVRGTMATPGPTTLIPVVGAALVVIAGTASTGLLQRGLSTRPMVWIGDRSYGWYLWHWPVIVFVRTSYPTAPGGVLLAAAIASLAPTALSYRYLEQPIRRNSGWRGRRAVGLGVACSAVSLVAFLGLANFPKITTAGTRSVDASLHIPVAGPTSCVKSAGPDDPRYVLNCSWLVPHSKGRIVLIGDSVAGALNPVMHTQANRAGYDLNVVYRPGCPFADVERVYPNPSMTAACDRFVQQSMTAIALVHPALVVLASRQSAYVHEPEFTLRDPRTGLTGDDEPTKARIWQDGLSRTLAELGRHRVPVVVAATVPQLAPFNIETCPAWRLWTHAQSCKRTLPRREVDQYRRASLDATERAVRSAPAAHLVDFTDRLCAPESCSTYRNGIWLYADSVHVSPAGSMTLAPIIDRQVIPRADG